MQCRSNDYDYMMTTVINLPTDYVGVTEPTLSRVSPVVAKEAHTDGVFYVLWYIQCFTVQITFIFIDFRVCDFAFAFKTQNAPCVSRFKRVLFSDRFQFAF